MTARRLEALRWIRAYLAQRGHSPSAKQIAEAVGMKHKAMLDALKVFERMGYIRREGKAIVAVRLPGEPALKAEVV